MKRKKMWLALAICPIILLSSCTDEPKPSSSNSEVKQSPGPSSTVSVPEISFEKVTVEGVEYNIHKYTAPVKEKKEYGGTNLALNKPTSTSGSLGNSPTSAAVDGNINNFWASADEKGVWFQVDLGEKHKIGRVEVVARQDGDQPGERQLYEVSASNDPEFKESEVIASLGPIPFEAFGTWIANSSSDTEYRYVRIRRTYGGAHFTMAEFRVMDTRAEGIETENTIVETPENSMMIMSSTGKVLTREGDSVYLDSYDFINEQRWYVEEKPGGKVIKSVVDNKCVTLQADGKLVMEEESSTANQVWNITDLEAGWSSIKSKTALTLMQYEGDLATASASSESKAERWDISAAYDEKLPQADTEWMKGAFGIMMHILPDSSSIGRINRNMSAKAIIDQVEEAGADYFLVSIGQMSGYYLGPNERFSSIVSALPDRRFTDTDFIKEFADECRARGMKFMVYVPTFPPNTVRNRNGWDWTDFGMPEADIQVHTRDSAMLWASVLREWSVRYGDLIDGWWVDGGAMRTVDIEVFEMLGCALRVGNAKAAVAYNSGATFENVCQYNGTEQLFPFGKDESDEQLWNKENWLLPSTEVDWNRDLQWTMLTLIGKGWMNNDFPRTRVYPPELWAEYYKAIQKEDGLLLLDVPINTSTDYTITNEAMEILKAVGDAKISS